MVDNLPPHNVNGEVAVIVPTRNCSRTLRNCLDSLQYQTLVPQIIVVDNGSTDNTREIATELADFVLDIGPERSAQRNAGAQATQADIVGFIDSDMILTPNVVEEAVVKIRQGAVSVIIPEHTTGEGFWASVIAFEHSLFQEYNTGIPRFFTRKVFDESGGYDEMMTGPEDRDLALRVAKLGPCALIDAEIIHDIGHISYFQTCAKAGYYAPGRALFSHKHGMEETKRVFKQQPWLRKPQKLLNPLGIGLFILKIGEILTASSVILSQKLHSGRSKLDPYK